jgi:diguanylate cyclase (GGDEF)-like protein
VALGLVILLGLVVVSVTLTKVDDARSPLGRVDPRLLDAAGHLRKSNANLLQIGSHLPTAFARPVAERLALASAQQAADSAYRSQFEAYQKVALGFAGEARLQQRVLSLDAQNTKALTALLGVESVTVEALGEVAVLNAQMAATIQELQDHYDTLIAEQVRDARAGQDSARRAMIVSGALALVLTLAAAVWIVHDIRRRWLRDEAQGRRNELESRLQRALEMAESEDDIFATVGVAAQLAEPHLQVEMLVADSSRAHLQQVLTSNMKPAEGCTVGSPLSCPAAVRGQTQVFESSAAIDACPYLRHRDRAACSAMCVPVTIAGRPMGVLHATAGDRRPPQQEAVASFELVARRAGERLSLMRAFARTEMQAQTDPLTSLLNRRSLEASAQELVDNGTRYVVAFTDLDHFKLLNDLHGHDAGDRALKLFAHVLRDNVRPSDIPARYGGEEFVVVLPDCTVPDAVAVMERVRSQLADAVRDAGLPDFTVSVGVAASAVTHTFSQVVEMADGALLGAKAAGRDRVTVVDGPASSVPDDPSGIPGLAASAVDGNSA